MGEPQQVDDRKTPMTVDELVLGLHGGWRLYMGAESSPSSGTLACLVAQACLETANGKSIHCFNLGNVKRSASWEGLWCMYGCDERAAPAVAQRWLKSALARRESVNADGTWSVWFNPPHAQTHFRAFASAAEGCAELIGFLANPEGRYTAAWKAAAAGDPEAFVRALGKAGYFTASVETYAKAVVSIARRVEPACVRTLMGEETLIQPADVARVHELVTTTLDGMLRVAWDRHEPAAA